MLVITILTMQFSFLQVIQTITPEGKSSIQKDNSSPLLNLVPNAPYGGVENIKSNMLRDSGFEEEDAIGGPKEFSAWGTASVIVDSAYTTEVYAGSYGGYLSVEGTEQISAYATNQRYLPSISQYSYMNEIIYLDFYYNCKSNPDIGNYAQAYVYFQVMSDIGNIYMYYLFSSSIFPSANDSYNAYFDVRGSLNTWINIDRNFTEDFISAFPARNIDVSYIRNIYFTCNSPQNPTGPIVMLFDEVSITNDTGFEYLADNGDFEDGDSYPWQTQRSDPGFVYTTENDYTEGSQSLNLTAYSPTASAYSEAMCDLALYAGWQTVPKGYFAQQPGDLVFDFKWKYTDTLTNDEQAYFYIFSQNDTYSNGVFYFLGDSDDIIGAYTNQSYATYSQYFLEAPDFGIRNTWNHFILDFYDIMQTLNLVNLPTYYVGFQAHADGPNCRAQLLVDEFQIITYPTGDPTFDNDFTWSGSDPIPLWMTPGEDSLVNITTDAHSGNYAANLTSYGGNTNVYCRRNMHLPVVNNLYTDFWWRLDKITGGANWAYSLITLRLESKSINYVIGKSVAATLTNSSDTYYYLVDGFNQTGVWTNLFRNVSNDVYVAFGLNDWNITQIDLRSYGAGSEIAIALFDDLYFVRDNQGPLFTSPIINPLAPEYGETVDVTIDVVDSTQVVSVILQYKIGSGSWVPVSMTADGDEYSATIPDADYGVTVSYYFEAEDIYGNIAQLGSSVSPYFYIVADTVDPVLVVEAPSEANNLTGIIRFNITEAYDVGSDIATFEITINSLVVYSNAIVPAFYDWNTTSFHNANIPIVFRLEDNAGNDIQINYMYTIDNPTPTPSPTDTNSFIGGILSISLVVSTSFVIITFIRRKRKV